MNKTEFENIGHYNQDAKVFTFYRFDENQCFNSKKKRDVFERNLYWVNHYIYDNYKTEYPTVIITLDAFKTLTKVPKTLISELIRDKVISDIKGESYFVNERLVWCKQCEQDNVEAKYRNDNSYNRSEIKEYEIYTHLLHAHYCYTYGDNLQKIPNVTPEKIQHFISYTKPEFVIHEHDFHVTELITEKGKLDIKAKCINCGYEPYIQTSNVHLCTKEIVK